MAGAVAAILLAGCGSDLGVVARDERIAADAIVRLDDAFAVAARRNAGRVEVVAFTRTAEAEWEVQVIAGGPADGTTAHLVGMGGETGDDWNAYFYGTAPGTVNRVVVDGFDSAGGQVTDGAWVLALREKDLHPDVLAWSFLDAAGAIVRTGTGITP